MVDEVEGSVPRELTGTLYRNGPSRNEIGGKPYAHLFDGDGMLSQFTIADGGIRYRNRYVRTNHFLAERAADKPVMRGYGQQRPGGVPGNAFRTPANVANTSVQYHSGNLLALYEGGRPWQVDPDTLETVGEYDFDGELKGGYTYSAHPTWDPATGELFNFGIQYGRKTQPAHVPGGPRGQASSPAVDPTAVRDAEPRLRADEALHGLRDRPARRADTAHAARPLQPGPVRSVPFGQADTGHPRAAGRRHAPDRGVRALLPLPHQQRLRGRLGRGAGSGPVPGLRERPPRLSGLQPVRRSTTSPTTFSRLRISSADEVEIEDLLSYRLRVPAARLAADLHEAPLRIPRGPAGRSWALLVDHQVRPGPRHLGRCTSSAPATSPASRSSCRAAGTPPRTTDGCCRSCTRRASIDRGW